MQVLSMIWGILAMVGMLIGFIPCAGALNWLNIPFAAIGAIVSGIALATTQEPNKGGSIAGLVCCGLAMLFGIIRLALGGGVV
jgi:hypothetical protein